MQRKSPGWTALNKKVISGILLVLILITSGLTACSSSSNQQSNNGDQTGSGRTLPAEQPESTQRVQSAASVQVAAKSSGPWGIALDEAHGFVWVAQPQCDPK